MVYERQIIPCASDPYYMPCTRCFYSDWCASSRSLPSRTSELASLPPPPTTGPGAGSREGARRRTRLWSLTCPWYTGCSSSWHRLYFPAILAICCILVTYCISFHDTHKTNKKIIKRPPDLLHIICSVVSINLTLLYESNSNFLVFLWTCFSELQWVRARS